MRLLHSKIARSEERVARKMSFAGVEGSWGEGSKVQGEGESRGGRLEGRTSRTPRSL